MRLEFCRFDSINIDTFECVGYWTQCLSDDDFENCGFDSIEKRHL